MSLAAALAAIASRIVDAAGASTRGLEAGTLILAALASIAHLTGVPTPRRQVFTNSILASAFGVWAAVQMEPTLPQGPLLNDVAILLFVVDLALGLRTGSPSGEVGLVAAPSRRGDEAPARVAAVDGPSTGHPLSSACAFVAATRRQALVSMALTLGFTLAAAKASAAYPWLVASGIVTLGALAVHAHAHHVRRMQILALIAADHRLPAIPLVEAEVARIQHPAHRRQLARRLAERLRDAERWYRTVPTARPPAAIRLLASFAPLVHEIAGVIVRDANPPARGLAQLELLLDDGMSPLYRGDRTALGERLQHIANLLTTDADTTTVA